MRFRHLCKIRTSALSQILCRSIWWIEDLVRQPNINSSELSSSRSTRESQVLNLLFHWVSIGSTLFFLISISFVYVWNELFEVWFVSTLFGVWENVKEKRKKMSYFKCVFQLLLRKCRKLVENESCLNGLFWVKWVTRLNELGT